MKFYPESTITQLEFDKVQQLLAGHCQTAYGKAKALQLRVHTHIQYIQLELQQTHESKTLQQSAQAIPADFTHPLEKELKLLGIPGAVLSEDDFVQISRLCEAMNNLFRWFNTERREANPALAQVIKDSYYEKLIPELIDNVIDDSGQVRDNASPELQNIRINKYTPG